MSKLNIIFDGHFIFYKNLFISKRDAPKSRQFLDTETDRIKFIQSIICDIEYTLDKFDGYNKIIFVRDLKSWRKHIPLNQKGFDSYKSNRKPSDDINWTSFYKCVDTVFEILTNRNIITTVIEGAEGDDLLYLWSNKLNEDGESAVIITADGDLKQILKNNDNNTFTIQYNNKKSSNTFYTKHGFSTWINSLKVEQIDENDIFNIGTIMGDSDDKNIIKNALIKSNTEEEDPMYILFSKILMGDPKDNIPSLAYWLTVNGRGRKRISEKPTREIYTRMIDKFGSIDIEKLRFDKNYRIRFKKMVETACTRTFGDIFYDHLDRNILLLFLDKTTIPEYIVTQFEEEYSNNKNKSITTFDKNYILKDTKYVFQKMKNIESSLFNL